MAPSRTIRLLTLAMVLVCTAGCDQVTKHLARTQLSQLGSVAMPGRIVEFTLAENPGAFLSLGAPLPQIARHMFTIGITCGLAFLLAYLVRAPKLRLFAFVGLALMWAGGMSNLVDRFARNGLVTDFMIVRIGPFHTGIFNLADFAIVLGTLLLAASLYFRAQSRSA